MDDADVGRRLIEVLCHGDHRNWMAREYRTRIKKGDLLAFLERDLNHKKYSDELRADLDEALHLLQAFMARHNGLEPGTHLNIEAAVLRSRALLVKHQIDEHQIDEQ